MKKFCLEIPILFLALFFPIVSFAEISQIKFTTDPQNIKPNTLSGPITIQVQDLNGDAYQTPETLDLQFITTSDTGEFLNSAGNAVSSYMSKNTSNRTFYYKDSSEGSFTITVNIRGRDTGIELDASQQITISSGAGPAPSVSPGEVQNASTETLSSGSSSRSTTNVSSLNSQLEVLAGNDRTVAPGSPIWFQIMVKKNTTGISPELNWTFGDGNIGIGPLVSHTYKYPGDYVVVLSAKAGDIFSVSRLKVKVVEPNITVSDKGEYLEISNNGSTEINLFNWKLESAGMGFIFQPNTLVLPKSSIKIDKNLLSMKGFDNSLEISLKNSFREEVFAIAPTEKVNVNEMAKNLENIKREVYAIQEKINNLGLISQNNNLNNQLANVISTVPAYKTEKDQIATNTENIIYEAPKSEGILIRLTNFIKRVFSK